MTYQPVTIYRSQPGTLTAPTYDQVQAQLLADQGLSSDSRLGTRRARSRGRRADRAARARRTGGGGSSVRRRALLVFWLLVVCALIVVRSVVK